VFENAFPNQSLAYLDALSGVFAHAQELGIAESSRSACCGRREALRHCTRSKRRRAESIADRSVHLIEDSFTSGRDLPPSLGAKLSACAGRKTGAVRRPPP